MFISCPNEVGNTHTLFKDISKISIQIFLIVFINILNTVLYKFAEYLSQMILQIKKMNNLKFYGIIFCKYHNVISYSHS